jgi:hypothetical protein
VKKLRRGGERPQKQATNVIWVGDAAVPQQDRSRDSPPIAVNAAIVSCAQSVISVGFRSPAASEDRSRRGCIASSWGPERGDGRTARIPASRAHSRATSSPGTGPLRSSGPRTRAPSPEGTNLASIRARGSPSPGSTKRTSSSRWHRRRSR